MNCPFCGQDLERGTLKDFAWLPSILEGHCGVNNLSHEQIKTVLERNIGYKCHTGREKKGHLGWNLIIIDGFWYYYSAGWHKWTEYMGKEQVIFT